MVKIGKLTEEEFAKRYHDISNQYNSDGPVERSSIALINHSPIQVKVMFKPNAAFKSHNNGGGDELGLWRNALKSIFGDNMISHAHHHDPHFIVTQSVYGDERDDVMLQLKKDICDGLYLRVEQGDTSYSGNLEDALRTTRRIRKAKDEYQTKLNQLTTTHDDLKGTQIQITKDYDRNLRRMASLEEKVHELSMDKTRLNAGLLQTERALEKARASIQQYEDKKASTIDPGVVKEAFEELEGFDYAELTRLKDYIAHKETSVEKYIQKLEALTGFPRDHESFAKIKKRLEDDLFKNVEKSKEFWDYFGETEEAQKKEIADYKNLLDLWIDYDNKFALSKEEEKEFKNIEKEIEIKHPDYVPTQDQVDWYRIEMSQFWLKLFEEEKADMLKYGKIKVNGNGRRKRQLCKKISGSSDKLEKLVQTGMDLGINGTQDLENVETAHKEKCGWLHIGNSYTSLRKLFNKTTPRLQDPDSVYESMLEFIDLSSDIKENLKEAVNGKV